VEQLCENINVILLSKKLLPEMIYRSKFLIEAAIVHTVIAELGEMLDCSD